MAKIVRRFFYLFSLAGLRQWASRVAWIFVALGLSATPSAAGEASRYLTGQLLVATAEMTDPRFEETVIYITRHDENGAMGFVINKPIAKGPIADLLQSLGESGEGATGEIVLNYGGPVEPNKAFILHSDDHLLDSSTVVQKGIAMTGDIALLRMMSQGKGPQKSLFLMGYAGWARGQLEGEIEAGAWFAIPAETDLIFGKDADSKWRRATDKRRIGL